MTTLDQDFTAHLDALSRQVRGSVRAPGHDGYDTQRRGFQTFGAHRPDVIVSATGVDDVRAAVEFAGAHGLPVAVLATGHGLPPAHEGGVLINTHLMTEVRVDRDRATARMAAGVRWRQVIDAAAPWGLAPLSGNAPHVGAISYTLGGGVGHFSRRYGYAADRVRSIDIVTADATAQHVTADSAPDLFWALRGGGGNFGVVTAMDVDLVPVPRLYGGGLFFGSDLIEDALRAWLAWTATLPDELTSSVALIPFPDVPGVPEPLRGRHVLHVRVAFTGDAAAGEKLVEPMRAVGPRLIDSLADMPCEAVGSICNDPAVPMPYHSTDDVLDQLDDRGARALLELAGPGAPDRCVIEIRHLGGALSRPPAIPNPIGNRDAQYTIGVLSKLSSAAPPADELEGIRARHRRIHDALTPWSTGGRFLNFLTGEGATAGQVRAAFGTGDYERLRKVKSLYDPANMFRINRNIPPR